VQCARRATPHAGEGHGGWAGAVPVAWRPALEKGHRGRGLSIAGGTEHHGWGAMARTGASVIIGAHDKQE
jgi:hypothetical protein